MIRFKVKCRLHTNKSYVWSAVLLLHFVDGCKSNIFVAAEMQTTSSLLSRWIINFQGVANCSIEHNAVLVRPELSTMRSTNAYFKVYLYS